MRFFFFFFLFEVRVGKGVPSYTESFALLLVFDQKNSLRCLIQTCVRGEIILQPKPWIPPMLGRYSEGLECPLIEVSYHSSHSVSSPPYSFHRIEYLHNLHCLTV